MRSRYHAAVRTLLALGLSLMATLGFVSLGTAQDAPEGVEGTPTDGAEAPEAAEAATPTAESLIEEGIALRTEGRDEEALGKFVESYELAPAPRTLTQIALAEQALGRWLTRAR